jgi:hypothetical protein
MQNHSPFFELFLKVSLKGEIVARTYGDGIWRQISGVVMWSHLGRSEASWHSLFPRSPQVKHPTLVFLSRNSYTSFVASVGAVLGGFDVIFWDLEIPFDECQKHLASESLVMGPGVGQVVGFVTEFDTDLSVFQEQKLPVVSIASLLWSPQDAHAGPVCQHPCGRFGFWSGALDGGALELVEMDRMVLVAQEFTQHVSAPKKVFWNTLQLTSQAHPYRFVGCFAALSKNGILNFFAPEYDFKDHFTVLKPTILFVGPEELKNMAHWLEHLKKEEEASGLALRRSLQKRLHKLDGLFFTGKMLKFHEGILDFLQRSFLKASRFAEKFNRQEAELENLSFVVHGPDPAAGEHVKILSKLGLRVVETYGGPLCAGGMMASHVYSAPHTGVIGPALPHVNFRLGAGSFLEYQLLKPISQDDNVWHNTHDKVQMTPLGFSVLGFSVLKKKADRRKHVD